MNITSFILVILFCLYLFYSRLRKDNRYNYITWGCVILGLEAGLRHIAVGPDTPTYYMFFQQACNSTWTEVFQGFTSGAENFRDPAFAVIEKLFGTIMPSWQLFLIAVATFYFYGLWKVLTRYIETLEGALLAFVLYLSLFNIVALSGLRQCIATGIAFLVIPLINDRKWKIVIPTVVIGATIHISLLVILALIPLILLPDKIKKIFYFISIVLIPIVAVSARSIITYVVGFIANDYYSGYANAVQEDDPIVYVALCSIISIYEYCNYNKLTSLDKTSFIVPCNILMTLAVPLIFLDGTIIRIGQYFTLYMTISLPLIFDQSSYRKVAYFGCIAFLAFRILTSSGEYYFFWETAPGFMY